MIHELALLAAKIFNRRIKDVGLTRSQWHVLYLLNEKDGLTQTELAAHLTMAKPTLGKIIDLLEGDGWVVRREDLNDRRAKKVFLTEKLAPLVNPLEKIVDDLGELTTKGFTETQRRTFIKCIQAALENLNEAAAED